MTLEERKGFYNRPLEEQKRILKEAGWTIEKLEKRIMELNELVKKIRGGINIGRNIIVWRDHRGFWIKVTDYKKGYWAEVPLSKEQFSELGDLINKLYNSEAVRKVLERNLTTLKSED